MDVTLCTMPISHPGWSVRLALARKRIEPTLVDLPAGLHPALLWLRGYRAGTVPAARIDGRKVEGSRAIVRDLEWGRRAAAAVPARLPALAADRRAAPRRRPLERRRAPANRGPETERS